MARTKKVYCLKKKGDYYYYKFPEMKTFRTTGLKSEDKAQKLLYRRVNTQRTTLCGVSTPTSHGRKEQERTLHRGIVITCTLSPLI